MKRLSLFRSCFAALSLLGGAAVIAAEPVPVATSDSGTVATSDTGTVAISDAQLAALGVRLEAPQPAAEAGSARYPARVTLPASAERAIVAPLAGTVESLSVAVGDPVIAGQLLATLFSADLGGLRAAQAEAATAERLARADRDRDAALLADGIIAARRMEETRGRHAVAAARLADAAQRLKLAGASAAGGDATLSLRAPRAGVVLARGPGVGERLEAGALVFRIADVGRLLLDVQVPAEVAGRLAIGDRLGLRESTTVARVLAIGHDASGLAQSVTVRAELEGKASGLRPGQIVEVERRAATADGWSLPDAALVTGVGGSVVYRRAGTGFQAVPVILGGRSGGRSVVRGPLGSGDRIAVSAVVAIKAALAGHGGGE